MKNPNVPRAFRFMDKDLTRTEMLRYLEEMIATIENKLSIVARKVEKIEKNGQNEIEIRELNTSISDTSNCLGHLQMAKTFILVLEGLDNEE